MAATSAFAQSAVTLTGNLDFAWGSAKTGATAAEKVISSNNIVSSTSLINLVATEDLGGGTTATAKYGFDPRNFIDGANVNGAAPNGQPLKRDEVYVGLSNAGVGTLKVGAPNSIGLTTYGVSSPFGTGIGSGYAKNALDFSTIRHDRSARFDSPVFNGFSVSALRSDRVGTQVEAQNVRAASQITANTNTSGKTELGAQYTNGPLNAAFVSIQQSSTAAPVAKTRHTLWAANYTFGATTVYGSINSGDAYTQAAAANQTKGNSISVKHTIGQIDLLAGLNNQTAAGAAKETVTGLRADYNLSKTTATYVGYEKFKAAAAANDQKLMSVGLRKSF